LEISNGSALCLLKLKPTVHRNSLFSTTMVFSHMVSFTIVKEYNWWRPILIVSLKGIVNIALKIVPDVRHGGTSL
jgi:hypothetical protein